MNTKKRQPNRQQVFLSHLHADRDISGKLQAILQDAFAGQLRIFNSSDVEAIKAGTPWREQITTQLKQIDVLLVLATPQSVLSPWVNFESGGAWVLGKPVIPCCSRGMKPSTLPLPYSELQAIALDSSDEIQKLIRNLDDLTNTKHETDFDSRRAVEELREIETSQVRPHLAADLQTFLSAFQIFVSPPDQIELSTKYQSLLVTHLPTIQELVRQLDAARQWEKIVEIKIRLREFFENEGRFKEGAEFGRRCVDALDALGRPIEALWTQVKHVGYLLVLGRQHSEARAILSDSLRRVEQLPRTPETLSLMFYCHRYIGISYLRDKLTQTDQERKENSQDHFHRAQQYAECPELTDEQRRPLLARIEGNFGNVAIEFNQIDEALSRYYKQLRLFRDIGDAEHVGITHLKIAEGLIKKRADDWQVARDHLDQAERVAVELRWIEGRGRIWEQRARLYVRIYEVGKVSERRLLLEQGLHAAREALRVFQDIDDLEAQGRVKAITERLEELLGDDSSEDRP